MTRKTCFGICLAICFLLFSPFHSVLAKDTNVKDCLEGKGECADISKEPAKDQTSKDSLKEPVTETNTDAKTGSFLLSLVKMVLALAVILVLIYGLLKFLNKRNKTFQRVKTLQNLGGVSVGTNKSVQMVRVGDKLYMLGVGENVEMLQEITDEDVKLEMFREGKSDEDVPRHFIQGLFSANSGNTKEKAAFPPANAFKQLFSKELDKLKQNRSDMIKAYEKEEDRHE